MSIELELAIEAHLWPYLRVEHFSNYGQAFYRRTDEFHLVVQVQGSRDAKRFAINLGVQPLKLPCAGGEMSALPVVNPADCVLQRRLSETGIDQWWDHDGSSAGIRAAVIHAASVFAKIGVPLLKLWGGDTSPLLTLTPETFTQYREDFFAFGRSELSALRLLIQLREAQCLAPQARAFDCLRLSLNRERSANFR